MIYRVPPTFAGADFVTTPSPALAGQKLSLAHFPRFSLVWFPMTHASLPRVVQLFVMLVLAFSTNLLAKDGSPPAVGDVVEIKFNAVNGGKIDLAEMKGKVVLIDFWATWCGPCVKEIPNVVAAYNKLHEKGFEIIGISLDDNRGELTKFIKKNDMPWPQYFDGKGWKNKISSSYGVSSIPAMWLIDKEGKIASLNARSNLESQVEALLAK